VSAIEVTGLRKAYGRLEAVRGVSFAVDRGEVFALLGPNGAGKTTTVEILEGFRQADAGEVRVLGEDPWTAGPKLRERIGLVLQQSGVHPFLRVREVVELFGGYYPRPRPVAEVLDLVGLQECADAFVRTLSGGQARRLDVALALVGDPDVVFLDEPTTGFDPGARRAAWAMLTRVAEGGTAVLLTTHYMDEAQAVADRVGVMRAGELVAVGAPAALDARNGALVEIRFELPDGVALADLAALAGGRAGRNGDRVSIEVAEPTAALHALTGWALERGVALGRLEVSRPTLEDVYLALTTDDERQADA
jgi:ABC-2 type transport system ATP-binding protein